MDLSNDLISKFAKITNDNEEKTTETTFYGSIVEYNYQMFVQIDGSDSLTPVETTSDIHAGERVTVMIKDHKAIVTGNISSPSASANSVIVLRSEMDGLKSHVYETCLTTSDYSDGANMISNSAFRAGMDGWGSVNSDGIVVLDTPVNSRPVQVHFLWQSKPGDCTLIECDNGKIVLIDGGEEVTADSTISYMYNQGVKKIDLIIATHSHSDHIGGLPKIMDHFGCKELIIREPDWSKMPDYEIQTWKTKEYHDILINKAESLGTVIRAPKEGEIIAISDEIKLTIYNTNNANYEAYNYLSFSILMEHLSYKYFLGADMCMKSEDRVLNKLGKVDVYSCIHSGYDDGTSLDLLKEIDPDYTIIMNPKIFEYSSEFGKIRAKETLYRLQYSESLIYCTEQNGTIVLESNHSGFTISADKDIYYKDVWWLNPDNNEWYWFKSDGRIAKNESVLIFDNTLQKDKLFNFDSEGICTNPY